MLRTGQLACRRWAVQSAHYPYPAGLVEFGEVRAEFVKVLAQRVRREVARDAVDDLREPQHVLGKRKLQGRVG